MRAVGLRAEDLVLATWNVVGVPVVAAGALAPILALGDESNALAGWVQLAAVLAAIAAIATRPAGGTPIPELPASEARLAFIGPLVGAVAFVAGSASAYLSLGIDGLVVGTAFVVITAAMVFGDRLPVIDAGLRRALILPFILVCGGIFNGFAADILDGLDVGALLASVTVDETGFGLFIVGMLLAGLGAFYAALVVAPRVLVAPEADNGCLVWPARFALYVVSAVLGIGWLSVIAG
ncbi:MAG: hypothetical protein ACXWWL_07345 [Candidatus Limnocylindria bacterium]